MSEVIYGIDREFDNSIEKDRWREIVSEYKKDQAEDNQLYHGDILSCLVSRKNMIKSNRDECGITEEMSMNQTYYNLSKMTELVPNKYKYLSKQSSYNVIRSCINTERSKIGKDKPKINILTENAPYNLFIQGQKADQYIETQFKMSKIYDATSDVLLQGSIKKTGILKVTFNKEEEKFECKSINPYNFYCFIPREQGGETDYKEVLEVQKKSKLDIKKMYPDKVDKLDEMYTDQDGYIDVYEMYYEGEWKVTFTDECILNVEKNKRLPYFYWKWTDDSENTFWGNGLADELREIQQEINVILYTIRKSAHDVASPKVLINRTAKVIRSHITNEIGAVLEWSGQHEPSVLTPPISHPQLFNHLDNLVNNSYKIAAGVSQMSTSGNAPASLMRSGKSMETYHNIEQERFYDTHKKFQQLHVEVAKYMLTLANEHYMSNSSKYDFVKEIDWKVLDVKKNIYRVNAYPVSLLSESPASRIGEVSTLAELQVFEGDEVVEMLKYPDIERVTSLRTSGKQAVGKICSKIVEGKTENPEPDIHIPLEVQLREGTKYYQLGIKQNLPDDKLDKLSQYLTKVKDMLQPLQAPMGQTEVSPQQEAGLGAGAEANLQNLGGEQLV